MTKFLVVGKMNGREIVPMMEADHSDRPLIGDVVTEDGSTFHEIRGGYGSRDEMHLWLLSEVPAAVKAVNQ